jgi:putative intracellular protease/amidase
VYGIDSATKTELDLIFNAADIAGRRLRENATFMKLLRRQVELQKIVAATATTPGDVLVSYS